MESEAPVADAFEPEEDDDEPVAAPRAPRSTPFGSVWDSQLGTSASPAAAASLPPARDDEDFDEPEIPEYLIAEQRRSSSGGRGGQGARGGRSAYQSAMERERYGRGSGGGINRYPDVSGRTGQGSQGGRAGQGGRTGGAEDRSYGRGRDERPRDRVPAPRSSSEPWSEVPPELEAMLRAQVAQKPGGPPTETVEASKPAPKRRTTRKTAVDAEATGAALTESTESTESTALEAEGSKPAPKRRTTRKVAAGSIEPATDAEAPASAPAVKPRATRKPAASRVKAGTATPTTGSGDGGADATPAAKRRTTRKPAAPKAGDETA